MLRIYNTLHRKKEEFKPIVEGKVSMYACGVTPYKPSHLGHALQAVVFDIMRRYFEYKGFEVTYVRNYTDVDDKIIKVAAEVNQNALEYSEHMITQTEASLAALRVRGPDFLPKVTASIEDIVAMVSELIESGHAYATKEGNVYFSVSSFHDYGKLSNQKVDKLRSGVRKDSEPDKHDVVDFALWKAAKPGEVFWESPWGKGRPGWHIECSVMSFKHLGPHFDLHGGGGDLIFPHHENEIAQSESIHHGEFANYWVHNGLLMVGEQKMSKSLGNDMSIDQWLTQYHSEVLRYLIISNHYRSHVQFVPDRYREATQKVYQMYQTIRKAEQELKGSTTEINDEQYQSYLKTFEAAMDDDFNTVPVIAQLHEMGRELNRQLDSAKPDHVVLATVMHAIKEIGAVIGLFDLPANQVLTEMEDLELRKQKLTRKDIDQQIAKREEVRKAKDYAAADAIRAKLLTQGINLLDSVSGTTWELAFTENVSR